VPAEFSAGAVIFRIQNGQIFYLLMHYEEGHWGSPKGHIEKGETIEETARREVREETGLTDIQFLEGFRENNEYFLTGKEGKVFKKVTFLIAETRTQKVVLSFEHIEFVWLPFTEALDRATFQNEKLLLQKAHQFIVRNRC
jgi:bis(5'-nucleosidyl)-tetraphosphatase